MKRYYSEGRLVEDPRGDLVQLTEDLKPAAALQGRVMELETENDQLRSVLKSLQQEYCDWICERQPNKHTDECQAALAVLAAPSSH
jgi:hypothetical protein